MSLNSEELKIWLCHFVAEIRRSDGGRYPANTLYPLLSGLLRYMREIDPDCPNFLDKKTHEFKELHLLLDNMACWLRQEGVDAEVKHATLITLEEERMLWEQGVLGTDCPKSLLCAVFYLNGINLCLRGGSEHRNLKLSQFRRLGDPDRYIYTENGSINHSGSFIGASVQNRAGPPFTLRTAQLESVAMSIYWTCIIITKMPKKEKQNDWFNLCAISGKVTLGSWYFASPVGEHTLGEHGKRYV